MIAHTLKSTIRGNNNKISSLLLHSYKFSTKPSELIELELKKSAHNYHPIPVVLSRGLGCHVWDVQDKVILINFN